MSRFYLNALRLATGPALFCAFLVAGMLIWKLFACDVVVVGMFAIAGFVAALLVVVHAIAGSEPFEGMPKEIP